MLRINVNIFPSGGYFFIESDGARIVGKSWRGVKDRVRLYRRRQGLAEGDVDQEVAAQACARNPSHCSQANQTGIEQLRITSLKGRVLVWIAKLRREQPEFVAPELAKQRAEICAKCTQNTGLPEGCASCRAVLREIRTSIIKARPADGRLNACLVTGEDLGTAVHLDRVTTENAALPAHCWRKRQ